jgi:hypothetical protein
LSSESRMEERISRLDDEVVSRMVVGETILVPIRGKLADLQRIFALDPVADFVWGKLDGTATLRKVRDEMVGSFEVDHEKATADLLELVDDLLEKGLATRQT